MSGRRGAGRASRAGALGFTVLAVLLTLVTVVLGSRYLSSTQYANEPVIEVVVAARDVPAAEVILETHLKVVKWPQSSVPAGAFKSLDDILGPEPRVPVSTIFEGEAILAPRLASPKAGTGMASLVAKGLRGYPVPVDGYIAEARLVYPGAHVDVLATLRDNLTRKAYTKLVLQNVRVLAVDGHVDTASNNAGEERKKAQGAAAKAVVTLLTSPEQAEILTLVTREGEVDLMLRNASDEGYVDTMGITPRELLGIPDEDEENTDDVAANAKPEAEPRRRRRRPRRRANRVRAVQPGGTLLQPGARPTPRSNNNSRVKTVDLGGDQ